MISPTPVAMISMILLSTASHSQAQTADYLNAELPFERRVDDLVSRMTLEEKVSQMLDRAPAIERLGIPEYNWWNEALHGVARSGLATVFPQAIGLAATWNDSLIYRMATVTSDEARAKHHEYSRNGKRLRYQGLTLWSPNINLFRDPRWGRGQETYGEDPFLTGRLAVQFIRGLQGDDPNYLKTVATVKHFAVHSGPEPERHHFDAVVSERDFRESYLPHFEAGIREGGAYSLMCAYNRVGGQAACANEDLIQGILRGEWRFPGFIVSDCGAIDDIYLHHKLVQTAAEAAALAVETGTDLDCGDVYSNLADAVHQGLISEAEIDTSVKRLFLARLRLGMFDPVDRVSYQRIPYNIVDQPSHRALAREVTRQSMVLLKNDGGVLPLRRDLGTIAVIGPNADQWLMLLGNYNGMPSDPVTPLRGIREAVATGTRVLYARGAELAEGFPMYDVVPSHVLFTPEGEPGLRTEYFATRHLEGEPLFSAIDSTLDANWRDRAPRADMDDDDFGVRWTGTLRPERSGTYRIGVISTVKFELFLDDSLVVRSVYNYRDEFGDPRLRATEPMELLAGRTYRLRVDAQESYGDAQAQLVWAAPRADLEGEAVSAAQQADAVVLFLGLTARLEGEEMPIRIEGFRGGDRTDLALPATQQRLLERVVAVGKPTVLVLLNGSALAVNWAQENVPAILEAWYPGQAAGLAIADVLFGDYNPAGRLPVTFYRSVKDLPPFEDYSMAGRTYRFFSGTPLYPFGHGLSYTTFAYDRLATSADVIPRDGAILIRVDVKNTGKRAGDEVVQLYIEHIGSAVERPRKELKGFKRITLLPGETRTVEFPLAASALAYWDADNDRWTVEPGHIRIQVGASSDDIRLDRMVTVASEQQQETIGVFDGHNDVGSVSQPGSVAYDEERQRYTISGSGANMWSDRDDFHFAWKRMSGNFILTTRAEFLGEGVDPHRKLGWIVRSGMEPNSPHVSAAAHGDGLVSLQFRRTAGGQTEEIRSSVTGADVVQLERRGTTYVMSVARSGDPLVSEQITDIALGDDVYVGLFVCAHNDSAIESATFRDVRITTPAPDDFVPYRDYIGSNLEIMDVATGDRTILYRSPQSLQAPNWTIDGKALIYNSDGLLYRFDLESRQPTLLNTGFATRNNNDHVLSFDGRMLAISHHSAEDQNQSIIYTLPAEGGTPRRVTPIGPSYLHGWSPDGKFLVYTGGRDDEYDIYKIPVEGGDEVRLTNSPGLDDGPEYSPDGEYIYFNSVRSGTMQIWRMRPDGSDPEQVTNDEYNNWFPHISPDGRWIVFLSYMKDVDPSDHPWYRHVYIRMMPAGGGPARVLAYVYGGQGTINVPSWSPDSKRVAFVSNTRMN